MSVLPGTQVAAGEPAVPTAGRYVPLPEPLNVLDESVPNTGSPVVRNFTGTGSGDVPAGRATAVSATVAVNGAPATGGSVRLWAGGEPVPAVSTVYLDGDGPWSSAQAVVRLNSAGEASVFNNSAATLRITVVVQGYWTDAEDPAGLRLVPLAQQRILDTRNRAPLAAGETIDFPVATKGGLPEAARIGAAVLNITAVSPSGNGSWRPFFAGVSTNRRYGHGFFTGGRHKAQTLITKLSADGSLSLTNVSSPATHYLIEVLGFYARPTDAAVVSAQVVPVAPKRLLDTTAGKGVPNANPVPANGEVTVSVGGQPDSGIPSSGLSMVALLLATRNNGGGGQLTTYPVGGVLPTGVSDVQYAANKTGSNLVWARVSPDGRFRVRNSGSATTHLWGDVVAYTLTATAPDPPTRVLAAAGNAQATVSWQAPSGNGGAPVTGYTVTAEPGGRTATAPATATTATVTGLTNGTEYSFTVTARNAAGTSAPSAPSDPVIPAVPRPPGQPLVTDVLPRDGAVEVTWSPPDTGTGSVTRYTVVASPGGVSVLAGPDDFGVIVPNLTNGTTYTFTVTAANGNGTGPVSSPSAPVSPRPGDPPVRPMITAVAPLNQQIDVQWVAPPDGGASITGYSVTAQPGGVTVNTPPDTTVARLAGLTNGTAYTLSVVAHNRAGTSPAAVTEPVTPTEHRPPAAPTDVHAAVTASGEVSLTWTAPADTGTAPIASYTVTATGSAGTKTVTATTTSAKVTGLSTSAGYTFTVTATGDGTGAASQATEPILPKLTTKAVPKVLSAGALATLRTAHTDGTLDFEHPPAEITGLRQGDFVIITAHPKVPRGLFRKVTEVRTVSGLVVVTTTNAGLDEVLGDGAAAYDDVLTSDDVQSFTPNSPGVQLRQPTIAGRTLADGAPGFQPKGTNIGIKNGELVISWDRKIGTYGRASVEFGVKPIFKGNFSVSGVTVKTHLTVAKQYRAEGHFKIGEFGKLEKKFPLATVEGRCFTFSVGPAPIVLCPELKVVATMEVSGEVGIDFSGGFSRVLGGSVRTENATVTGFDFINDPGEKPDNAGSIKPYGAVSEKFAIPVELVLYFYGVAGPGIKIGPYLKAAVDTRQTPWWSVCAGVEAEVFLRLRLFKYELNATWPLLDTCKKVAEASGAWDGIAVQPGRAEIPVDGEVDFAVAAAGTPPPVWWNIVVGPGSIDENGHYTANRRGSAIIEATPKGGVGEPARAQVTVGRVPGTPEVRATAAPLSARVTWAEVPSGDVPITRYAVTTYPPSTTTYVEAGQSNYTVYARGLRPGGAYWVMVTALTDTAGFASETGSFGPVVPTEVLDRIGSPTNVGVDADGDPDSTGTAGRGGMYLSDNGRYAFFATQARSNLAPPEIHDPDSTLLYLLRKDLVTGEIVLASRGDDGRTPMPSDLLSGDGLMFPYSSSSDGNIVAFAVPRDPGSGAVDRIVVHNIAERTSWAASPRVAEDGGNALTPVLSADGNVLAYNTFDLGGEHHLWRVVRNGGPRAEVALCLAPIQPCYFFPTFDMSSNGNRIVYMITDGSYRHATPVLWDSGRLTNLMPNQADDEAGGGVIISGDGTTVAVEYTYSYLDNTGHERWVAGIAAAPISSGRLDSADLVVSDDRPIGSITASFLVGDLSGDGRLLTYSKQRAPDQPTGGVVDTRAKAAQGIASGAQYWAGLSDNGRLLGWSQWDVAGDDIVVRPMVQRLS